MDMEAVMYIRESKTAKSGQELAFLFKSLLYLGLGYLFLAGMTSLVLPLILAFAV